MPKLKQSGGEPRTERPHIPGYGISKSKTGMLPWKWAAKTLAESREYWIVTVRPDGRPHAMIIWGLWFDLEGVAELVNDADLRRKLEPASLKKYGMKGGDGSEPVYRVRPTRVFGLIEKSFPKTATRWTFN